MIINHLVKGKPNVFGFFLVLILSLSSCGPDEPADDGDDFDRGAMLTWYADAIIIPSFQESQIELENLLTRYDEYKSDPTESKLMGLQEQWMTSYQSFIRCSSFNFGPADQTLGTAVEQLATFPADTNQINNYVASEDYSLENLNRDTRGFLTIEYFLFDEGMNNAKVMNRLADSKNQLYLEAVMDHAHELLTQINQGWAAYRSDFILNDGTDPGSSVSLMYNELIKNYELIRNYKVGLPAGKRVGQVGPEPEMVEGYYSGNSLALQRTHLDAFYSWYQGTGLHGESGIGWVEYLTNVVGGPELITDTEYQYSLILDELDALPNESFATILRTNPEQVDGYYEELSKCTRYFKSDMSSVLGIAITYDSGDGD